MALTKRQQPLTETDGNLEKSQRIVRCKTKNKASKQIDADCVMDNHSTKKPTKSKNNAEKILKRRVQLRTAIVNDKVVCKQLSDRQQRPLKTSQEKNTCESRDLRSRVNQNETENTKDLEYEKSVLCSTPQKSRSSVANNEVDFHVTQLSPISSASFVIDESSLDNVEDSVVEAEDASINSKKSKKVCKKLYVSENDDDNRGDVSWRATKAKRFSYSKKENSTLFYDDVNSVSIENDDPFHLFGKPLDQSSKRKVKTKRAQKNGTKRTTTTKKKKGTNETEHEKKFREWCDSFSKDLEEIEATDLVIE